MKNTQIVWPNPADLIPRVKEPYVDVDGVLDNALKLILPSAWVAGDPSAPPSSNLLFNSMHGLGKSLLAATMAVRAGEILEREVPAITLDCHEDIRDHHLRGAFSEQADGSLAFVPGPFPSAIHLANAVGCCFLLVEEISALTPGSQKMFNAMTDWRKGIYIPQIGQFVGLEPGCRVIIVGTMNPSAYGGVYTLNDDLRSRFDEYTIRIPAMRDEMQILKTVCPFAAGGDLIEKTCQLAKESRTDETDYKLSTRDLRQFLEAWFKLDGGFEAAVSAPMPNQGGRLALDLLANKFEGTERRFILDRIKAIFNYWIDGKN